ncbi:hypothetical protein JW879_05120 [candidate division WOR-3 bacterium]|nr:hypothetical protein [candidate division WOR-3 bacterium]
MIKMKLSIMISIIIMFCILLIDCEKLKELLTNVTGKVYADSCKVVIAVKGDLDLFSYLDDISDIDAPSLREETDLLRGFDIGVGADSLYNITMLSFGETYFLAVVDDGSTVDILDSLDHVGFYGPPDTMTIGTETFVYSIPEKIDVQEGIDENDIDIINFVEYRWFVIIYQLINQ